MSMNDSPTPTFLTRDLIKRLFDFLIFLLFFLLVAILFNLSSTSLDDAEEDTKTNSECKCICKKFKKRK
jgi:hypothetical protein